VDTKEVRITQTGIAIIERNDVATFTEFLKIPTPSVWEKQVHASFKKVVAFDLLFMMLGALIGAGIITAVLR
jgi:hypothetical protein